MFRGSVYDLRCFMKSKVKTIALDISEGKVKNPSKAAAYIAMLQDILDLPYYDSCTNTFQLMHHLKEVTAELEERIRENIRKADEYRQKLLDDDTFVDEGYLIPDETDAYKQSVQENTQKKLLEAEADITADMREKELCNKLKGIIARPKGFFSGL